MPIEMENIRKEIEKSLRKYHPGWGEKKIKEVAYATAWKVYKQKQKGGK